MTPEQRKEEIGKAYVHAVAARHGFKIGTWSVDDGCLDVTIGSAGTLGGGTLAGPKLDLQLKCTSRKSIVRKDHVAWKLSRTHYDRLIAPSTTSCLLVVLVLPEDERHWVSHTVDTLVLRRCAYFRKMTGLPAVSSETTVVRLPKANVLSPDALAAMMTEISTKGAL
jgi:hypothetical protein